MRKLVGVAGVLILSVLVLSACGSEETEPVVETASVSVIPTQVRSFQIESGATVESDASHELTTLTVNVRKLDNSIEGSLGITVRFGEVVCQSRRPYLVYAAQGGGGKLFEGDRGHHELSCQPFVRASEFEELPDGVVS